MSDAPRLTIFDGHNDMLLRLHKGKGGFLERSEGQLDLPRAREGGLGGGFCAVFIPSETAPDDDDLPKTPPADDDLDAQVRASLASFSDESSMPPTPELAYAQRIAMAMTASLYRTESASQGQVKVVRTVAELAASLRDGIFAALLHFEGAEALDPEGDALEVFYRAGLRSIGPVWSRPNAYGHGVPFKFGQSPDTGPGLTDAGKELIRSCNRLGIMIDLSHLNEQGFWDVAKLSRAPLVATHSNVHAISPSPRNLTDKQLAAIKESDGMVGVNFHVGFLRPDGKSDVDVELDVLIRHLDYLVEYLGIDRVGFGSDFDGAVMPSAIADASKLPNMIEALRQHGYDDAALRKLAHENWLRVLGKTLKA